MKVLFRGKTVASETSYSVLATAGQSVNVAISTTGTVALQYRNNESWIELVSITATTRYAVPSNMVVRCVISANAGVIDAELV